jgi:hypothetical protein
LRRASCCARRSSARSPCRSPAAGAACLPRSRTRRCRHSHALSPSVCALVYACRHGTARHGVPDGIAIAAARALDALQ